MKELVEIEREEFHNQLKDDKKKIFDKIKIDAILKSPVNIAITCDFNRFGPHVLGRRTIPETCNYSTVLAIENLWLSATAEGIGVGWVSFFKKDDVKRILKIPDNIELIAYLTLCYVIKFPEVPELEEKGWNKRLPLEELVFENEWNKKPNEKTLNALRNVKI